MKSGNIFKQLHICLMQKSLNLAGNCSELFALKLVRYLNRAS